LATKLSSLEKFRRIPANPLRFLAPEDLGQRVTRLASQMFRFREQGEASTSDASLEQSEPKTAAIARLKKIVASRAVRNRLFGQDVFADPAWDMMLYLTIAMAENRHISMSSLCLATNVPATTALRQVKALKDNGLLMIVCDPNDGRRKHVILSDAAYAMMTNFATMTN
jgi:Winged helix DNA-binding domain